MSFVTLDMLPCSLDWGSVVSITTHYGLHGPGNDYRWSEIFRTRLNRPLGSTQLLHDEYQVIPGGKAAWAWG